MSKKLTIGRRLCTLVARISFLIHCKFEENQWKTLVRLVEEGEGKKSEMENSLNVNDGLKIGERSAPVNLQWLVTCPHWTWRNELNTTSNWIRIPFRHADSRVDSQSTVANYMQMTALGERDVRSIIVEAETERLGKIIAVEVKAIIISRRRYFSCSSGGFCSADVCECPPLHLLPLSPSFIEFPAVCFSASVWGAVWRVRHLFFWLRSHRSDSPLAHQWKVLSLGLSVPAMPTIYTTDGDTQNHKSPQKILSSFQEWIQPAVLGVMHYKLLELPNQITFSSN